MLVVMGPIMEIPVTDLFAAAILPGVLLAVLYAGYTTVRCMINPKLGPVLPPELRATSMKHVWIEFFLGLVPPAALVFAALGNHYYWDSSYPENSRDHPATCTFLCYRSLEGLHSILVGRSLSATVTEVVSTSSLDLRRWNSRA